MLYPTSSIKTPHSQNPRPSSRIYQSSARILIDSQIQIVIIAEKKREKEYSLDKKIGTSLLRASANASSPHGYQSTFGLRGARKEFLNYFKGCVEKNTKFYTIPDYERVGEDKGSVQRQGDLCACGSVETLCWRIVRPWL